MHELAKSRPTRNARDTSVDLFFFSSFLRFSFIFRKERVPRERRLGFSEIERKPVNSQWHWEASIEAQNWSCESVEEASVRVWSGGSRRKIGTFSAHTDKVIEIVRNFQRTQEQYSGSALSSFFWKIGCVSYSEPKTGKIACEELLRVNAISNWNETRGQVTAQSLFYFFERE